MAIASRWRSKAATGGLSSTTWRSALPPDMRLEMHIDTDEANAAGADRCVGNAGDEVDEPRDAAAYVEEVAARLRHRALQQRPSLSVAQLGEADIRNLPARFAAHRAGGFTAAGAACRPACWRQPVAHCMRRWPGAFAVALTLLPALLPALAVKTRPLAADVQRSAWPACQASRRVGAHPCRRSPFQWRLSGAAPPTSPPRPRSGNARHVQLIKQGVNYASGTRDRRRRLDAKSPSLNGKNRCWCAG